MALLEICCYSMECALTAQQNGADRVELCAAPKEGGLTPSLGVLKSVRQRVTIPVHPIIRPRGGDFCYSDGEFAAILEDVRTVRELGFPGLVTGVLDVDGNVDMPRMEKIMAAAGPLAVTFHRAFDMCANPLNTLNNLTELGIARVLTSGQNQTHCKVYQKLWNLLPIVMLQSLWPEQESVRKTCTTSSMPECWKSIAPRERGKPHRCVIVIKDCPCHQMHTRTSIRVMS
ncbi:copper homeostasis protein [Escherichia coli]|nr:copper homeostasis protein [Escherichia coli]